MAIKNFHNGAESGINLEAFILINKSEVLLNKLG